jgi:predicted nucleic acid-binding protein
VTVLLDTSVLVDCLRQLPKALTWLTSKSARPSLSVISLSELLAGARSQADEKQIELLVVAMKVLPVSRPIAVATGMHLKHFRKSHSVEIADALIAATAEHHGLELATLNVKHFPMFKRLKAPY